MTTTKKMTDGEIADLLAKRQHRLDQALAKIGVSVVEYSETKDRFTAMLRVPDPKDARNAKRWQRFIEKSVLFASTAKAWTLDLSKVFYATNGSVRFLWRIVAVSKAEDTATPKRILSEIALEALREGAEVTEVPLIGRVEYVPDPANGKLKGAYPAGSGEQLVASLFAVTGGGR